jgi:hypothetical protein
MGIPSWLRAFLRLRLLPIVGGVLSVAVYKAAAWLFEQVSWLTEWTGLTPDGVAGLILAAYAYALSRLDLTWDDSPYLITDNTPV